MIVNIIKFLLLALILFFFMTTYNYYISEKNIDTVKSNRKNQEINVLRNISNLPVLLNDTDDVIEFNSGFNNSNEQKFKRSFWELFK
tara:strand:+ start:405 stop:665 length:261 start_codon:yes stop_codon:yes gene_type:complete